MSRGNNNNNNLPPMVQLDDFEFDPEGKNIGVLAAPSLAECDLILRAAQRNEPDGIRDTIKYLGVPPSHANGIGQTALHVAALWGHIDCVKVLIELGANVNAANQMFGSTPLHTVLSSAKPSPEVKEQIVDILLEAGAKTGTEDRNRNRPIDYIPSDHPNKESLKKKLKPPKRNAADILMNDVIGSVATCRPTYFGGGIA